MSTFWFQMLVQVPIIIVLWWVVARDAAAVKRRTGAVPAVSAPSPGGLWRA
jgi:membrane protein insertase Oxa1/YidC/SpoIIIJ